MVEIAKDNQVVKGRKMRLDTTVVETNIHYPADSSLRGDGVSPTRDGWRWGTRN